MRIGLAQIRSVKGQMADNLQHHVQVIESAVRKGTDFLVFPELSLTSFSPEIAEWAAIPSEDAALEVLQNICDRTGISVAVGAPTRHSPKPLVSLIVFRPNQARRVISKQFLHEDEFPFFSPAPKKDTTITGDPSIAFAICYELSVPEHIEHAVCQGCELYLVSAAKTREGISRARICLNLSAQRFKMPVMLVNCVGECEGKPAGGSSFIMDENGNLLKSLSASKEQLLIYDSMDSSIEVHQVDGHE